MGFGQWALGSGLWAFFAAWGQPPFLRRNAVFLSQMATWGLFFGGFLIE